MNNSIVVHHAAEWWSLGRTGAWRVGRVVGRVAAGNVVRAVAVLQRNRAVRLVRLKAGKLDTAVAMVDCKLVLGGMRLFVAIAPVAAVGTSPTGRPRPTHEEVCP